MLRASHLPPLAYPALTLSALRISLIPTFNLSSSPSNLQKVSTFSLSHRFLHQTFKPFSRQPSSLSLKRILHLPMEGNPHLRGTGGSNLKKKKKTHDLFLLNRKRFSTLDTRFFIFPLWESLNSCF